MKTCTTIRKNITTGKLGNEMKQPVRSFALGLLTAGIILFITFYFTDDSKEENETMTIDHMIKSIETEGYHVLTESEYASISTSSEKATGEDGAETHEKQKNSAENNDTKEEDSVSEKDNAVTYTLSVESGMSSIKISDILEANNIVDDAESFDQYLEDEGFSTKLQLGEYELSSKMSRYDIAELISN